jgi:hypothetical protein
MGALPRTALIGNMNNNHFALARYLRERSVEADLLLFNNEHEHFQPAADTYDLDFMAYTKRLSWGISTGFLAATGDSVKEDLRPYAVLIGCGLAPAFCGKADRKLDVFVPYGDDIWNETRFRLTSPQWLPSVWAAVAAQRTAIRSVNVIHMTRTNAIFEHRLRRLAPGVQRWLDAVPMVHAGTYSEATLDARIVRSHWGHVFKTIRADRDFVAVYHARHHWTGDRGDPNSKGTDRLLRGWAAFVRDNPGKRCALVTIEYGPDVSASQRLVHELGVTDSVVWMPKMLRKDLMVGLALCDVVCGEFEHSWIASGVLYEALVAARPILAWREDDIYRADFPWLYPILNARSVEQIAARLDEAARDVSRARQIGQSGAAWYQEQVVRKAVDRYVTYIEGRAAGAA